MTKPILRPALLVATLLAAATLLPSCWFQSLSANLAKPKAGYVRLNEPVVVQFNQKIDLKSVTVVTSPAAPVKLEAKGTKLMVTPVSGWKPAETYKLQVKQASSADHSLKLNNWSADFKTQPHAGIAGFLIDGKAVAQTTGTTPVITPYSKVTITFTNPMDITATVPTFNDKPLPSPQLAWEADHKAVDLLPSTGYTPYSAVKLGVASTATTAAGDVASDLAPLAVTVKGIEPANPSSGISAGFQTIPALNVVIDNAGLARPQAGLQSADLAFEYISEYSISRFTLMYYNNPPNLIGPVRSCRMINPYLGMAFHGITFCSGASDGTLGWLWGNHGAPGIPVVINDYDNTNHFYRVDWRPAPHNLFTDAAHLDKTRQELPIGGGNFVVDPPHPDSSIGVPAAAPSIPLHGVFYLWDGNCTCYRPYDSGSPRVDAGNGGQPLAVKTVVIMHVPFSQAGWVEDVNGGAQSIIYGMNGYGPAELWSDGKMVQATWHMGSQNGQNFWENLTEPLYFTDNSTGQLIRLNTGLTWVHVVGNGQTQ